MWKYIDTDDWETYETEDGEFRCQPHAGGWTIGKRYCENGYNYLGCDAVFATLEEAQKAVESMKLEITHKEAKLLNIALQCFKQGDWVNDMCNDEACEDEEFEEFNALVDRIQEFALWFNKRD